MSGYSNITFHSGLSLVAVYRAVTRPVLILLPVLGLTWLCGVLVHLSAVVAYIFITLNAFQVKIFFHSVYFIKTHNVGIALSSCQRDSYL